MKVALLKSTEIIVVTLPNRVMGSYWISNYDDIGNQSNLISIDGIDGHWILNSNDDVKIRNGNVLIENVILNENQFYNLEVTNSNIAGNLQYLLYTYPSNDLTFEYYKITDKLNEGITIGNSNNSNISFAANYIDNEHAKIIKQNNEIYIIDNGSKNGLYVNHKRVNQQILQNGDNIFIMGLRFIFLKLENEYCLMINKPNNLVTVQGLSGYNIERIDEDFDEPNEDIEMILYSEKDYFYKNPRFISIYDTMEIKIDPPPNKEVER